MFINFMPIIDKAFTNLVKIKNFEQNLQFYANHR